MKKKLQGTLSEHITFKCPRCHATLIAKVADLKTNKLLRCPVCRTPINDEVFS